MAQRHRPQRLQRVPQLPRQRRQLGLDPRGIERCRRFLNCIYRAKEVNLAQNPLAPGLVGLLKRLHGGKKRRGRVGSQGLNHGFDLR